MTLSRELVHPSEAILFSDELIAGSDRTCAILGAAIVDQVLVFQLQGAMRELTKKEFLELFFDNRALLQTMASRIDLSYVLKLNEKHERDQLHSVRRIRNAFAHATRPISFEHHLIKKECAKLSDNYLAKDSLIAHLPESRRRFIGLCTGIYGHFHKQAKKSDNYDLTVKYLKSLDFSPTA
jgi:hypothetical protein